MKCKICEIADINSNNLSKNDRLDFINYLDTANLNEGIIDEVQYLKTGIDKVPSRAKRKVETNDILISTVRPNQKHYGIIKTKKENLIVSTGFAVLRAKKHIVSPDYLYKFLIQSDITNYLQSIGEGSTSTFPAVKPSVIGDLEINLPPLPEQKAIANILSSLDEKIEINNKINQNLENMAQEIFKQWFVDFEFPNEDGKPYKSSGGEMVESELGMIPKDWEVVELDDIINVNRRGFSPKYADSGTKVINQRCIRNHNIVDEAIQYNDLKLKKPSNEVFLKPKDILINSMGVGTLGRVAQRTLVNELAIIHSCITIIRANENKINAYILGRYFISNEKELVNLSIGTTGQTSLKNKDLAKIKIILPSINIQNMISDTLMNISINTDCNLNQNRNLSNLRDTLLPKLMSGEIRVPLDK